WRRSSLSFWGNFGGKILYKSVPLTCRMPAPGPFNIIIQLAAILAVVLGKFRGKDSLQVRPVDLPDASARP
ncbi:hypothetical protein WA852_34265, partial [Pseudomonas aeruginosa]